MSVIVGKHINDITLNDLEYLLDEKGDIKEYETEKEAKNDLINKGFSEEDLYYLFFIEN